MCPVLRRCAFGAICCQCLSARQNPSARLLNAYAAGLQYLQIAKGELAQYALLLELFAFGTWAECKGETQQSPTGNKPMLHGSASPSYTCDQQNRCCVLLSPHAPCTEHASQLPQLTPQQVLKIKQLTVVQLASKSKVRGLCRCRVHSAFQHVTLASRGLSGRKQQSGFLVSANIGCVWLLDRGSLCGLILRSAASLLPDALQMSPPNLH